MGHFDSGRAFRTGMLCDQRAGTTSRSSDQQALISGDPTAINKAGDDNAVNAAGRVPFQIPDVGVLTQGR